MLYFGEIACLLDNDGRLVDTHLGSYLCKLKPIEGRDRSTTEK